jgi:hypothetical protein
MIASVEQYAAMLDAASAGGYALAAVNVTSSETLNGAMRGFAEAGADGIVQITTGAAEFLSGGAVNDMALGARALAEYARVLGERYPVLIALHTDHAPPEKFDAFVRPLIDESRRRRQRGEEPLFHSHMFDGSTLTLEDNLRFSARLLDELAPLGVVLEVESGVVGGAEDGIAGPRANHPELYTTTDDLMRVADVLGPATTVATCWPRPSGTSTASTRMATSSCARPSCAMVRWHSPSAIPAPASATSSTAAAGPTRAMCARRSPPASSSLTWTPTPNTRSRGRSPTTCSPITTAC